MEDEKSPNWQLDEALKTILEKSISGWLSRKLLESQCKKYSPDQKVKDVYASGLINKLIKDGYVEILPKKIDNKDDAVVITFEGIIFNLAGGYVEEAKIKANQKCWQSIERALIVIGAVAAGTYGIFEIYWHYHPCG